MDSKPLVEQLCAGYDEKIAQMVKVPCDVRESGKQYIYTFSDIPENAVSVVDVTWNCTTNLDSSRGVRSARKVVQSFLSRGAGNTEGIYPVTSPVTLDAFYTFDEPGYAIRYFVFINAEGDPIGYTTAILSTR